MSSDVPPGMTTRKWNRAERDYVWTSVVFTRKNLKLPISPVVASSMVLLHKLFAAPFHRDCHLYLHIVASLFLSCKIHDTYRPLSLIYKEYANVVKITAPHAGHNFVISTIGNMDYNTEKISETDCRLVARCEVEFLNIINWNYSFDLPFNYFNQNECAICQCLIAREKYDDVCSMVLHNISLIMKNEHYLELPPIAIAAAACEKILSGNTLVPCVCNWMQRVKSQYQKEVEFACQLIDEEEQRCCPYRSNQRPAAQ